MMAQMARAFGPSSERGWVSPVPRGVGVRGRMGVPMVNCARHVRLLSGCQSPKRLNSPNRVFPKSKKCAEGRFMAPRCDHFQHENGGFDFDVEENFILRAVELAGKSITLSSPHPNAGCVIVKNKCIVGEGYLFAQGTISAEVIAVKNAQDNARDSVAYLNLEPGDCHGDNSAVDALINSGIKRVVIGMRHPLHHLWGKAIHELRKHALRVDVLGEDHLVGERIEKIIQACREVNTPLLYRAMYKLPFSILKYAMTLDGKIAASTGHAAWVSSKESRKEVFYTRACSDAIIVGGNTVRRDDPQLTTRQEGGHIPIRIVMSRTLRLPENAKLWDTSKAHTIVMTQRKAREDFQLSLSKRGVEIVEFDFLSPTSVMEYCYQRGFLQVLWECGGMLSAPAIAAGVIHKVMAFVAPKIIGGVTAPSPVGELGFVEMTQALNISNVSYKQIGPDLLVSGYMHPLPDSRLIISQKDEKVVDNSIVVENRNFNYGGAQSIRFYKPWDLYGAFSNFSSHEIMMPKTNFETNPGNTDTEDQGLTKWKSVEHYYQSQKFAGSSHPDASKVISEIFLANSPELAASIGRGVERTRPEVVRKDWGNIKLSIMYEALKKKFQTYPGLKSLLLSTENVVLVEASPNDYFWGCGRNETGQNHLGQLLMRLRDELSSEEATAATASSASASTSDRDESLEKESSTASPGKVIRDSPHLTSTKNSTQ